MSMDVIPVSALVRAARETLEARFPLLWVAGETSNLTRAASGHVYFTLKDDQAQVRCAMFRNRAQALPWRLENGMRVEALALVSLYEARGDFQLIVENLRQAGVGSLFEAYERLRRGLEAEGLFAATRKRPLPALPRRIGIVTSPQAAALRDVLAALERRAPHLPVVLYPTPVQGEGAGRQIADALALAGRRAECDLLLLVRGGGSLEDLWSFNEEVVARAIATCPIPVVSGVGHETDTSIADFVADLRAATPTAAAELATAGWVEAAARLAPLEQALGERLNRRLRNLEQRLDLAARGLVHPARRLAQQGQALDLLATRLAAARYRHQQEILARCRDLDRRLAARRPRADTWRGRLDLAAQALASAARGRLAGIAHRLDRAGAALDSLNPAAVLSRGYGIVRDARGRVVSDAARLAPGEELNLRFHRGEATARVLAATPEKP